MKGVAIASVFVLAIVVGEGKSLYETKCAQCHGRDGVAKPPGKGSKNFNDPEFQSAWTVDAIAKITSEGRGKMPGYRSKLTPEQIQAVSAHIKTLGSSK